MRGYQFLNSLEKWSGKGNFTLNSTRRVLQLLGDPQDGIPSIHVGGTNGKGSTSTAIASILAATGARVGLSTSPHLLQPTERVVIDGFPVSDEIFDSGLVSVAKAAQSSGDTLTYHEALTVLSFYLFRELECDYMVIEVGLGGALDASNVMKAPLATITTSIGYDHEAILGNTLSAIARQKAGIMRRGVPHILGDLSDEAIRVFIEIGNHLETPIFKYGEDFIGEWNKSDLLLNLKDIQIKTSPLLKGGYQASNLAVAAFTAEQLGISSQNITEGINLAFIPGRFECLEYNGTNFIVDSAHNPQAFHSLRDTLKSNKIDRLKVIFGVLSTKRWKEMLDVVRELSSEVLIVEPNSDAIVSGTEISDYLAKFGVSTREFGKNYRRAIEASLGQETVLVCGSMYFLGEIRALLQASNTPMWLKR